MMRAGVVTQSVTDVLLPRMSEEEWRWKFSFAVAFFYGQHSCNHVRLIDWLCDGGGAALFLKEWIPDEAAH